MALIDSALCSVSEVKDYMKITGPDYDSILESLINRVTRGFEKSCRRIFKKPSWKLSAKTDISFIASTKKINSAAGNFNVSALWIGSKFTVTGSTSNDETYTVDAITGSDITTVETLIDEEAGASVTIEMAGYVEYHDGKGRDFVAVKNPPIASLTNLYDDPGRDWGSETEITSANYVLSPTDKPNMIVLDGGVFYDGIQNVKITYIGGYASIPGDLGQACIETVVQKVKEGREGRLGIASRSEPDGSISLFMEGLLPDVKRVLGRYKRVLV